MADSQNMDTGVNGSGLEAPRKTPGILRSHKSDAAQAKADAKYFAERKKQNDKAISDLDETLGDYLEKYEELLKEQEDVDKALADANKKALEEHQKQMAKVGDAIGAGINKALSGLKTTLEKNMDSFISIQESMSFWVEGNQNLEKVTNNLNVLMTQGYVKQEDVYKNLHSLVESGITQNMEQRAFLQTLSDDLSLGFNVSNTNLRRYILLAGEDITANRMAMEYSLKSFLQSNYETAEYIKTSFESVSDALFEAQALMSTQNALGLEASVQTWLGSMESAGVDSSTIASLAQALGSLGSGNLSDLSGSALQNLLIMGANNAGLSYGDLLTGGLTGDSANKLFSGILQYVKTIGRESNVVLSEYGKVFGLSSSDIVAMQGMKSGTGSVGTNIDDLLNDLDQFLYFPTKLENTLENIMYNWGTSTVTKSDGLWYTVYKMTDMVSSMAAEFMRGTELNIGFMGNGASLTLADIIESTPLLTAIPSLIGALSGGGLSGHGVSGSSLFSLLGSNRQALTHRGGAMGKLTSGTSASVTFNSDEMAAGEAATASGKEVSNDLNPSSSEGDKDINDIYDLMGSNHKETQASLNKIVGVLAGTGFLGSLFGNTGSASNDNTSTVNLSYIQDAVTVSAVSLKNIYSLLVNKFTEASFDTNVEIGDEKYDKFTFQWTDSIKSEA